MKMYVSENSRWSSWSGSSTWAPTETSRAETGSSAHPRAGRKQAHQGQREHGFAAAGFARADVQRHFVHWPHPTSGRGQFQVKAAHFEQSAHAAIIDLKMEMRNSKLGKAFAK